LKLLPALATIAAALALAGSASAAASAQSFQEIASGLNEAVYVTSAPGDASTLYVVEQRGTIEMVRNGQTTGTFLDIRDRVLDDGERGLLSVAFDPGYAQNHRFYVDYSDKSGDSHVTELTASNGVGDPSTAHDLLVVKQPYPNHKGGQLQFDRRGYLYVGFGDGGTDPAAGDVSTGDPQNHAQTLSSPLGKLLRIKPDVSGAKVADRRARASQSVAVLVRPRNRQPLDRRRRRGAVRGDRLPAQREDRNARELRLEPVRRPVDVQREDSPLEEGRLRRSRVVVRPRRAGLRRRRRLRASRPLLLRRLLRRLALELQGRAEGSRVDRDEAPAGDRESVVVRRGRERRALRRQSGRRAVPAAVASPR
jgi:Glucose/sorbosone dehydrogenases